MIGVIAACGGTEPTVGQTYKIANAHAQRSTVDWPCFYDRSDYDVWLANSDSDKQNSVEQNATQQKRSTWLEPGDTVKVVEVDHDTLRVSIIASIASDRGKQCWTLSYAGYLFQDR